MSDELSAADRVLLAELFRLGQELSSYVLRVGSEAADAALPTPEEEWRLGVRLSEYGAVLRMRAEGRRANEGDPQF